ncbi:hypothetical protein HY493_01610 [Candidatus Woesearchaeota archaeon]|nr:hypothetical protein [Candidatus Woesearchaeota archaeon]
MKPYQTLVNESEEYWPSLASQVQAKMGIDIVYTIILPMMKKADEDRAREFVAKSLNSAPGPRRKGLRDALENLGFRELYDDCIASRISA